MITVNKSQSETIEKVLTRYNGDKTKATLHYQPSKELGLETFARCMIEGWQVEKTKEEKVKDLFAHYNKQGVGKKVIRDMLNIFEIKIEGIND